MDYLILIPVGYLLGCLPFGLIAGWVLKGVDVRKYGSGKTGMTNVMRIVGVPAALLVLVLDMGKGVSAVVIARVIADSSGVEATAGLAALVGHNWPVFIGFRGGRGTATGWGGLLMLSPLAGLMATVVGVPVVAITRYMSLGSILGASSGAIALIALAVTGAVPLEYIWYGAIGGTLVVARHKDNIQRLLRGEERKIGERATVASARPEAARRKGLRWSKSV